MVGLVALEPEHGMLEMQEEKDAEVGAALAMHVVAAKPLFLSRQFVSESSLKYELDILRSQVLVCSCYRSCSVVCLCYLCCHVMLSSQD